ncbi:MAG: dephospho-CoA kinase [Elusimicrobiota bacterium]|jgi:dephospho-CoA kinase|nr:dephospho-CoA kinase [Elusimicrobiota bacterium]
MTNFKTKDKIIIGLTGGIACGKSTAAQIFKKNGAEVICADALAAKYFNLIRDKIERYFKTSDKNKIALEVFKSVSKRKWLEKQIHPFILREAEDIIKTTKNNIVVFDAPLLFEAGLKNAFDLTLCVYAASEIRLKRSLLKGIKDEDFKMRERAQTAQEQKAQTADIVLYNNASRKDLENKIKKLYKSLKQEEKYGK